MDVTLVLFKKDGTTKAITLPSTVAVVGRRQDCDLCIPLKVVSRKHCEINQDQGVMRIRDMGSRNGTFVNGRRVEEAVLNPGDSIDIGPIKFRIQMDGVPAEFVEADKNVIESPDEFSQAEDNVMAKTNQRSIPHNPQSSQSHNATEIFDSVREETEK